MSAIDEKHIRIDTGHTTLLFEIKHAHTNPEWDTNQFKVFLEPVYYGPRLASGSEAEYQAVHTKTHTFNTSISCFGNFDSRQPMLLLENADGSLVSDFSFVKAEQVSVHRTGGLPSAHGITETTEFVYEDSRCGLRLVQAISVCGESDVLVSSFRLENHSGSAVRIRRLMSLQLDLYGKQFTMHTFDGAWGRERNETIRRLGIGVALTESLTGTSSHLHNPFFLLRDDRFGEWYAFNLLYSGNHRESVEISTLNAARVMTGINDFAFGFTLHPGQAFYTPQAVVTVASSRDEATARMHDFVNGHIVRGKYASAPRPVVVNHWEGTAFGYDREKLLQIARAGADAGAELFVLDDGWFSTRNDAKSGLGDWRDNEKKTGGLAFLAAQIRAMGMKFGIWMEPEMVNPDSDLFRAHPGYASLVPGREPMVHRCQYNLDLADPEVTEYLFGAVCEVIDLCAADYVKWDFNRTMTEFYSPVLSDQGEYDYRYMLGLYSLLERLTERYPDVLFESCAAGGGRYDLGMLCYMPQTWTSDDTDARMRVAIQEGTLCGYPQSTMTAHVSGCPNYLTRNSTSVEDAFNVACIGCLGYESDLSRLSEPDKETIRAQISWYKAHRDVLQYGDYYLLDSVSGDSEYFGWIVVSKDRSRAVAMLGYTRFPGYCMVKYRFKGLDPEAVYRVEERPQRNRKEALAFTAKGDILLGGRIDFGEITGALDRDENSNSVYTKLFFLEKV